MDGVFTKNLVIILLTRSSLGRMLRHIAGAVKEGEGTWSAYTTKMNSLLSQVGGYIESNKRIYEFIFLH